MANSCLTLYYQNCRGLKTKLHTLYTNVISSTYDIIILTETWLCSNISDSEYIDSRYQVFRMDRDRSASGRRDGGGVLVAVSRTLCAAALALPATDVPLPPLVDQLMVQLNIRKRKLIICAVYIPPKQNYETYRAYFDVLHDAVHDSDTDLYIIGDFNLPSLQWENKGIFTEPIINSDITPTHRYLINFMSSLDCVQLNSLKNKTNNILDLCISNNINSKTSPVQFPLVPPDGHHPPFQVTVSFVEEFNRLKSKSYLKFCYKYADYEKINEEIASTNWSLLFMEKEVEEAVSIFYERIYAIIKKHVPTKVVKSSLFPNWFTPALINLYQKKERAWIRMKRYNTESNYCVFAILRKQFKEMSDRRYKAYLKHVEHSIKNNIKFFWTYINNRKRNSDIPNTMHYKNVTANSPAEICSLFSTFFQSVFEPSLVPDNFEIEDINIDDCQTPDTLICSVEISKEEVHTSIKELDVNKGAGVDNINAYFLRQTADAIDEPICYLFNKCLRDGVFPKIWKSARIVPVYKGGSKKDIENYRPISILPTLSKLCEKLVHKAIYPCLHSSILQQQHGFVERRSTVTNLLIYTTDLFEGLDANKQIDSVYTDFRKAFDRVDHKILLEKIAFNGIRGNLWRWFKSYISNRTQKVVIKGFESPSINISSGVPQGSILGPLLFVLFINDINKCFDHCKFLLYADDLKIYKTINTADDHIKLQNDLNQLSLYCSDNKLELSIKKCKSITFTKKRNVSNYFYSLCGTTLSKVNTIKDLGITLDSKLHFDEHIENIINKAFRMYGFVIRSGAMFKQTSTFVYLFKSLIRCQVEYAVSVWNPLYEKYNNMLEKIQKKYLRYIHFKCNRQRLSYNLLLEKYNLIHLKSRRTQLEVMLLHDLIHNRYDSIEITNKLCYSVPPRSLMRTTRPHRLFATSSCRTNAGIRSPLHRMAKSYNNKFNDIDIIALQHTFFKKSVVDRLSKTTYKK